MMMWGSPLLLACVAWRFCRAGRRSGVATKNSREARENERRSREKNKNKLLPLQSPRGFSALARLYYLVRPTKTAMLRRLLFSPCRYLHVSYTVKPLLSRHLRDLPKCPLNKGCKHCTMFVTDQNSALTLYCDKVAC